VPLTKQVSATMDPQSGLSTRVSSGGSTGPAQIVMGETCAGRASQSFMHGDEK